jgi:hypothetical protein
MTAVEETPVRYAAAESPTVALASTGGMWRFLLALVGGAGGFAIVWMHPNRLDAAWYPWAALGTVLGVLAGWSFGSGLARFNEVVALQPMRRHRVLPAVLLMALVAFGALPLSYVVLRSFVTWQGQALAALAAVGALPAGAAMVAIRILAIDGLVGPVGRRLDVLLRLRQSLSRLILIFGSLFVVLTLSAYGPSGFAVAMHPPTPGQHPRTSLIIYTGLTAAAVIALMYLPTADVLRRRSLRFIDEEFSLDGVDHAHLVQAAEDRSRLEVILGLERTTFAQIQNALVILSPVLASAGVSLLPGF